MEKIVKVNSKKSLKNLNEQDILASLENAIELYKTKEYEDLVKSSTKKATKKAKLVKQQKFVDTTEDDGEVATIKNKAKKSKKGFFARLIGKKTVKKISKKQIMRKLQEERELEERMIAEENTKKSLKTKAKRTKTSKSKSSKSLTRRISYIMSTSKNHVFAYRKELMTFSLALVMVSFISFSSYIAYAYISGDNKDIVQKVSSHLILPANETPKVYIIQSDKSEIFNNPAFRGIQLGDNVLSYENAGKVIIYRAKEDKIVNTVNTSQ